MSNITFLLTVREAKPCPECDGKCLATTQTVDAETWKPKGKKVTCFSCGGLGPIGKDLHDAVRLWNQMEQVTEFMLAPKYEP